MLKTNLQCHSLALADNEFAISAEVNRQQEGGFLVRYLVEGDLEKLTIPLPQPSIMADRLWEHTCFEAFIGVAGETAYYEFNFSPSGQWAAYAFTAYRERCDWVIAQPPAVQSSHAFGQIRLAAKIPLNALPKNPTKKPLQLALTAVLETHDKNPTYWALHHPASAPDFHAREGFILTLDPF